jgi:hypothetical protein
MITFGAIGAIYLLDFSYGGGVRQQPGRTIRRRTRRRPTHRFLDWLRHSSADGVLSRIRLGTAGRSPRLRRWVLAVVLLGVALVPYPTLGAIGAPPAASCRLGCRAGTVPGMVRWTAPLPGGWDVTAGLTGTTPASGRVYMSVGDGVAAVGAGLTVTGYSASTGKRHWQLTLTGFGAGAAIVSVRTWPGEVTAGVSYPAARGRSAGRTEVVISPAGVVAGRYPAAAFGGAVASSAQYTVIVGPAAVTSYDNATGHVRWQRPTGSVTQAWRTDGSFLYMTATAGGVVESAPVTALRKIDMTTGAELTVAPLEALSFRGTLSAAFDDVVLFTSAAGVTAYSGTSGAELWRIGGAVPESTDPARHRIYLTRGSNLIGVDPQTGRITATASGSAVDGAAGVYVVRNGVALGLDQGANGDAWGYDLAAQRVTVASAGLPWPHYFVDLGGIGGSADPASRMVVIAACSQLAPSSLTQPASASASASAPAPASTSASTSAPAAGTASAGSSPTPAVSPSAAASAGQACLKPELVALSL